jgi:hypothetical protein
VIRRHHPLEGQELDVVRGGKRELTVRHPDTFTLRIPREWTDADGVASRPNLKPDTELTVEAVRELLQLVDGLRDRSLHD